MRDRIPKAPPQEKERIDRVLRIRKESVHNAKQGFFEQAECEWVASFLPEYLTGYARFAYYSGWRRNEIARIEWLAATDRLLIPALWCKLLGFFLHTIYFMWRMKAHLFCAPLSCSGS
jgi:hypothetical protein